MSVNRLPNSIDRAALLAAVPVGAANAQRAREIWQAVGMWAESSTAIVLLEMSKAGMICGEKRPFLQGGVAWFYWRGGNPTSVG